MGERSARFEDARDRIGGAAIGALAGTLAWSLFEAVVLIADGARFPRVLYFVALAAFAAAAVGAALCAGLVALGSALRSVKAIEGRLSPRILLVWTAALIATSYAAYGATRVFDAVFSGDGVKRLALCAVVPLAAFGFGAAAHVVARRLAARPAAGAGHRSALLLAGAIAAACAIGIAGYRLLEPDVFEALALAQYWPFAVTLAGGLAGGALLRPRRRLLVTAAVASALLMVAAGVQVARKDNVRIRAVVDARSDGTRLALAAAEAILPIRRRLPAATGAGSTCVPGVSLPPPEEVPKARRNAPDIILVTVDALRWDHTSLSGYARDTTPELKRWSAEASVFSSCYTPSDSTRQTFPSIFTGLLPTMVRETGGGRSWGPKVAQGKGTIAEYLAAAGYDTVAVVSDTRLFNKRNGALAGFDDVDSTPELARKKARYTASFQVDRIISALSTYRKNQPMFVWAHVLDTHQPYRGGPHPALPGRGPAGKYDASIRFVDEAVGRLVAFARSTARRDNTYVIVAADHGQAFQEHGTKLHGHSLYQEETHVPLLVWGPRVRRQKISAPVSLVDLVPSLLDVAGIHPFEGLCGESLEPVWEKRAAPPKRPVYLEVQADEMVSYAAAAYIDGGHELIIDPRYGTKELYDLQKDPLQKDDLAAAQPEVVKSMTRGLVRFYRQRGIDPKAYGLAGGAQ